VPPKIGVTGLRPRHIQLIFLLAGRIGNRDWKDGEELLLTSWRNPFAAAWFLKRQQLAEVQGASAP